MPHPCGGARSVRPLSPNRSRRDCESLPAWLEPVRQAGRLPWAGRTARKVLTGTECPGCRRSALCHAAITSVGGRPRDLMSREPNGAVTETDSWRPVRRPPARRPLSHRHRPTCLWPVATKYGAASAARGAVPLRLGLGTRTSEPPPGPQLTDGTTSTARSNQAP